MIRHSLHKGQENSHCTQTLNDLIPHRRLYSIFQMPLWVLLAHMAGLELLYCQCGLFLHRFVVCFGQREHFLRVRVQKGEGQCQRWRPATHFSKLGSPTLMAFSLFSACTPQSLNLNPSVQFLLCKLPSMLCSNSVFL